MSLMNILTHINIYEDNSATSNPSQNNVKWSKDVQGILVNDPTSRLIKLNAGETLDLFSSNISVSSDITTTYDIFLKPNTSNTYVIKHSGGTAPVFKTLRSIGADATSEIKVKKNATLLKFESTGGALLNLSTVVIGDEVRLGEGFNASNRGKFKVLSVGADFFTVENAFGVSEIVLLGVEFENELKIHSASGIQVGYKVDIKANFSSVSFNTYEITDVSDNYIEIYSSKALPDETDVANSPESLFFYKDAKKFIYLESNKKLSIKINGSVETNTVEPFIVGGSVKSGVFMSSSSIKKMEIENKDQEVATVFYVTAE